MGKFAIFVQHLVGGGGTQLPSNPLIHLAKTKKSGYVGLQTLDIRKGLAAIKKIRISGVFYCSIPSYNPNFWDVCQTTK